jgi:hypothetical protein
VPYLPGNTNKGKPYYYQPRRIRLLTTREEEEKKEGLYPCFFFNAGKLLLPGG